MAVLGWQSSTLWGVPRERCRGLFSVLLTIQQIYSLHSVCFLAQTEDLFEEIFYYNEDWFRHLRTRTGRGMYFSTAADASTHTPKPRPIHFVRGLVLSWS